MNEEILALLRKTRLAVYPLVSAEDWADWVVSKNVPLADLIVALEKALDR